MMKNRRKPQLLFPVFQMSLPHSMLIAVLFIATLCNPLLGVSLKGFSLNKREDLIPPLNCPANIAERLATQLRNVTNFMDFLLILSSPNPNGLLLMFSLKVLSNTHLIRMGSLLRTMVVGSTKNNMSIS